MSKPKPPDAADIAAKSGPDALRRLHETGGDPPDVLDAAERDPTAPPAPGDGPGAEADPVSAALATLEEAVKRVEGGDGGAHLEPDALVAWCVLAERDPAAEARLRNRLRKAKADLSTLRKLLSPPKPDRGSLHVAGPDDPPRRFLDVLPSASVSPALMVPPRYVVSPLGIAKRLQGPGGPYLQPVASAPILLCARLRHADGLERWRLAWKRGDRWQVYNAGRGECLDPKRLIGLADHGAPVWGGSAAALAEYLHDVEAENAGQLPCAEVTDTLGWQGPQGERGFLCGRDLITPAGKILAAQDLDTLDPLAWAADRIYFDAAGPGDGQLADSLVSSGTFKGWRDAVAKVARAHPRAALALYTSLATPLLMVIRDVPNFAIDWSYPTSTGKTTVLRIAASVWGRPADGVTDSFLHSWDSTKVWIERAASTLNGLPLILDDSKRAKKGADVAEVIYGFSQGQGRGRGLRGEGTRKTRAFRSLLLSSGEQPLVNFTQDGGTRARVLSLWGPPFGKADRETGAMVLELKRELLEHNGHAGRRFVAWLLTHRDQWGDYRAVFRNLLAVYLKKAGGDAVAGRLCEPMAFLHLTAHLAHKALGLPWECEDPFSSLWEGLTAEASDADRAADALRVACSWAQANSISFFGRHQEGLNGPFVPAGGWAGRWDREPWGFLAFFPERLKRVLREAEMDFDSVVRIWKSRGWIKADRKNIATNIRGPWDGKTSDLARLITVRRGAYEAIYEAGGDQLDNETAGERTAVSRNVGTE